MRRHRQSKVARRAFKKKQTLDIFYVTFCAVIVAGLGYHFQHIVTHSMHSPIAKVQAEDSIKPLTINITPLVQAPGTIDSNTNPTQDEIESYIKRIFVEDSEVAIAISRTECSPQNKTYPRCVLNTQYEYSVGIFQINLYNAQQKIHADRIPGTSMDEKIEWLKNPFNNTLYAYWVYATSGWSPWSTYTSQAYLNNL